MKLSEIEVGSNARIFSIDTSYKYAQRLIEIGFSQGTVVKAVMKGLNRSLTAYSVKNTVIALRSETADKINVILNLDGSDEQ